MRPAAVELRDLSSDDIHELTRLLCRRPDYGIARPSGRWLARQQEKIEDLPKSLLISKSIIQRLAIGWVTKYDRRQKDEDKVLPPRAILCSSHQRLNPFLIRNIFLALTKEVSGTYMSALRMWPGKSPAIAAFLTRIDSLHAFWVSKEAFTALFGTTPHDDRYTRVQSNCEACILSAIGANGRILMDLIGWLSQRTADNRRYNEESKARGSSRRKHKVYLHKMVDAWIDHLKPDDAADVRRQGGDIAAGLKEIWPALKEGRREVHAEEKRGKHREIRHEKDGTIKITEARGRNRGYGIALPRTDLQAAAIQRNMADLNRDLDGKSVYREGTVVNGGKFNDEVIRNFRELALDSQNAAEASQQRPGAPEPQHVSGVPSVEAPSQSFIDSFEAEVPLPTPCEIDEDDTYTHEFDERDYEAEQRGIEKVQDWYQLRAMDETNTDLTNLDRESIHPAFQVTNESAVPLPLDLRNKPKVESLHPLADPLRAGEGKLTREETIRQALDNSDTKSVWTDISVYTTEDAFENTNSGPPLPQIPAQYRRGSNAGKCTPPPAISSVPSLTPDRGSSRVSSLPSSHGPKLGRVYTTHGSREAPQRRSFSQAPQHPAQPHALSSQEVPRRGESFSHAPREPSQTQTQANAQVAANANLFSRPPPRPLQTKADRRKYLFVDTDSNISHLTEHNKKHLRNNRGIIRDVPPEANPFVRADSVRHRKRLAGEDHEAASPRSRRGPPQTPTAEGSSRNEMAGAWDDNTTANMQPSESASNAQWKKKRASEVTTLGYFLEKQGRLC